MDVFLTEKEATEAPLEPLMVLEQPEMTPSPPAANQAMKGTGEKNEMRHWGKTTRVLCSVDSHIGMFGITGIRLEIL